jgi:hypothetical protein
MDVFHDKCLLKVELGPIKGKLVNQSMASNKTTQDHHREDRSARLVLAKHVKKYMTIPHDAICGVFE